MADDGARGVLPLVRGPPPRTWLRAAVAGGMGVAALVGTYWALVPRLPATIPSHFAANGVVDGTMAPLDLVISGIGTILFVAAVFVGLLYGMGRSEVLRHRFGPNTLGPLSTFAVTIIALSIPATFALLLASAAGLVPTWFPPLGLSAALFTLTPVLGLLILLVVRRGPATCGGPAASVDTIVGSTSPGRNLILRCSACGQPFERSIWYILGPRFGGFSRGEGTAYYLRCPGCGERGWNPRIGWGHLTSADPTRHVGSDTRPLTPEP
jgi:Protein of unknown function (DUF1648)